ncbi:MAG: Leucyl aminopeptidase [Thermoleophilia bacterium]|nr:Leucyl aminopeptidase [Thermoleophilia bacterium]
MQLRFSAASAHTADLDLLAVLVDDPTAPPEVVAELDSGLGGSLARELARGRVKADAPSVAEITGGSDGPQRIALVGFGPGSDGRANALRVAGAKIAGAARAAEARTIAIAGIDDASDLAAVTEGAVIGAFRIHHHRTDEAAAADDGSPRYDGPESLTVLVDAESESAKTVTAAHIAATAQNWARDLANAPANLLTPVKLAEQAEQLAAQHEALSFRSLDRAALEAEGFGMFAAVARGAFDEPRLIVLEWNPAGASETDGDRLALVGKAVTFDTGGISIKPSGGMQDMKMDKGGGCAVLGAMRAIAELGVQRRVIAVVGATMNMPDGNAYRPGDVVTAKDGTTVEIISTDAEGRLVLGDCITYVRELGCGGIVDAATLTGAIIVALGHRYTGAIARPGTLVDSVLAASEATGDLAWHMPLHDEYKLHLKTECADLKNSGTRDGGALAAASFLQHFAKDTPFVHLDIAGSGMLPKPRAYYGTKGASGAGVRLMAQVAATWSA